MHITSSMQMRPCLNPMSLPLNLQPGNAPAAFFNSERDIPSGRSDIAGAIRYALSRWSALTRYLDDGTVAIDNNAVERAIRPLVLGRKNWLFAGSDAGGERAAAIDSLIETAKLNGLDPEPYLH